MYLYQLAGLEQKFYRGFAADSPIGLHGLASGVAQTDQRVVARRRAE
jgi:hypothetical protein